MSSSEYIGHLERAVEDATSWAMFQPNGEALWAKVRHAVEDLLATEWKKGALVGDAPEQAYFVRCDETTMTRDDIESGLLVCVVGIAPRHPAEFVTFRVTQKTG